MNSEKEHLTVEEVPQWLGVGPKTVYRLAQAAALPGIKVGGQWRFSREIRKEWERDRISIERLKGPHAA